MNVACISLRIKGNGCRFIFMGVLKTALLVVCNCISPNYEIGSGFVPKGLPRTHNSNLGN